MKLEFLGKIPYDINVEEYVLAGKPLLKLPPDSSAYLYVKIIMEKIGYIKQQ